MGSGHLASGGGLRGRVEIMSTQLEFDSIKRAWLDAALPAATRAVSDLRGEFTVDDVRRLDAVRSVGQPGHVNWWGILFSRLSGLAVIVPVGYKRSTRGPANGRVVTVWRSVAA